MLYLAEVQKKARVLGNSKVEFKLLACQRSEHSWSAVGEELIAAPDDVPQNSGSLVLLELSASRHIQRYSDASRQLVSILQNFSRLQDKFKTQEEEIEQWKQSLTYQSQELNRREVEMETRQEQFQQLDADLEKLEQQRTEIEADREEVNRLQEEFQRKSQELEGAWAQLNGEQRRFEERQDTIQGTPGLSRDQINYLQDVVNRLSGAIAPTDSIREQLNTAFDLISHQQVSLDEQWQSLDKERGENQAAQDNIDHQRNELQSAWNAWHEAQNRWLEAKSNFTAQQTILRLKQDLLENLNHRLQQHRELKQSLIQAAEVAGFTTVGNKVDLEELESMPLEDLKSTVQSLCQEWEKNSRFVNSQEEELAVQQQEIDKIKARMDEVSEYDRLALETELSDEQESYRMLYETLVGQRRNLQEREMIWRKHEAILARREGLPVEGNGGDVDLEPILGKVTEIESQLTTQIQDVEQAIGELQDVIAEQETHLHQQADEQNNTLKQLKQNDHDFENNRAAIAEKWGIINTTHSMLETLQNSLHRFKEELYAIANITGKLQETSDYQLQSISEIQQTVQSLSAEEPQLAAS